MSREQKQKKRILIVRILEYALDLFAMLIPIVYVIRNKMLPDAAEVYTFFVAGLIGFIALLLEETKKKEELVKKLKKASEALMWFSLFWATLFQAILWGVVQFIKIIF